MNAKHQSLARVQTYSQMPGDIRNRLLLRWRHVLRFSIGEGDVASLDQIPNAKDFPKAYLTDDLYAGDYLGVVLGVAALKLWRPWAPPAGARVEIDLMGGCLEDLASVAHATNGGRLRVIGGVVEMALRAPERLPVLIARLDALDNDDLHRMAMDAVQGRPGAVSVFEGLME